MLSSTDLAQLIERYPVDMRPREAVYLGAAGGLSGAEFWRLDTPRGPLCLRAWLAEHPTMERLAWIHAVLQRAQQAGFQLAPTPLPDQAGRTFVSYKRRLWQLEPWMPGQPPEGAPAPESLITAAMRVLAEFHTATQTPGVAIGGETSPGVISRLNRLRTLQNAEFRASLEQALTPGNWLAAYVHCKRCFDLFPLLAQRVGPLLESASQIATNLQPCVRDVWRDNLLVQEHEITGLVDFGAMNVESPAADVARLLGSLAIDERSLWQAGLTAYEEVRPLSDGERTLVTAFDQSFVALAAFSWIEWIYIDQREFTDRAKVASRLTEIAKRAVALVE